MEFSFSASGWLFIYQLGVAHALQKRGLHKPPYCSRCTGSSGGALVSAVLAIDADVDILKEYFLDCVANCRSRGLNFFKMRDYVHGAFLLVKRHIAINKRSLLSQIKDHKELSINKRTDTEEEKVKEDNNVDNVETKSTSDSVATGEFYKHEGVLNGRLGVSVTILPSCKNYIITKFESQTEIEEAISASCTMSPVAGFPFRLSRPNDLLLDKKFVFDGGFSCCQPYTAGAGVVVTVAPFYSWSCDIKPSQYVPVWWGIYPPNVDEMEALFELGVKDTEAWLSQPDKKEMFKQFELKSTQRRPSILRTNSNTSIHNINNHTKTSSSALFGIELAALNENETMNIEINENQEEKNYLNDFESESVFSESDADYSAWNTAAEADDGDVGLDLENDSEDDAEEEVEKDDKKASIVRGKTTYEFRRGRTNRLERENSNMYRTANYQQLLRDATFGKTRLRSVHTLSNQADNNIKPVGLFNYYMDKAVIGFQRNFVKSFAMGTIYAELSSLTYFNLVKSATQAIESHRRSLLPASSSMFSLRRWVPVDVLGSPTDSLQTAVSLVRNMLKPHEIWNKVGNLRSRQSHSHHRQRRANARVQEVEVKVGGDLQTCEVVTVNPEEEEQCELRNHSFVYRTLLHYSE